jgi:hypothetical protein
MYYIVKSLKEANLCRRRLGKAISRIKESQRKMEPRSPICLAVSAALVDILGNV